MLEIVWLFVYEFLCSFKIYFKLFKTQTTLSPVVRVESAYSEHSVQTEENEKGVLGE